MADTPPPSAQPPPEPTPARLAKPSSSAAGLAAVAKTAQLVGGMGLARGVRALLQVNQSDGFDCQSCAWPSPDADRHLFEFCENGAKAVADEATKRRADRDFFARHSVATLATESDFWLNAQGRLTEPLVLRPGATHYESISWDDAFALIARELCDLSSPDAAAFYTSGRTSNEAAFLWQLFARAFGTNNLPDCSNMCHESSGVALTESIGIGKGTVKLEDFEQADAIFVIGQNPGTNHPRMLASLEAAKRRGATIVSVNPLPEIGIERFKNPQDFLHPLKAFKTLTGEGTRLSDLWLQPRIGGDLALFKGLMKEMLEAEVLPARPVLDRDFIRAHTHGFEALESDLRATMWEHILTASGVSRDDIKAAAAIAIRSRATICCWAMGLTQQPDAVATIQQVVNFLLLRGNIGRPGAGVCPVRGHSNVQGDRTMGICERMPEAWLKRLDAEFGIRAPRTHGFDTVETIRAMHDGRVRVFIALGGNFLSATPDTEFTAQALRNCTLTVQISTKLNRAHLVTGRTALILPCLGRSERDVQAAGEQFVTTEDSMGIINASRGKLEPASPFLVSEPAIVCRMARAVFEAKRTSETGNRTVETGDRKPETGERPLNRPSAHAHADNDVSVVESAVSGFRSPVSGFGSPIPWAEFERDYDLIRERIARVVPGFENFNQRVREGSFYLPNAPRDRREWKNSAGRAHFVVAPIPRPVAAPGEYVMMTIRTHDQFNTTIYGLDDRYRGVFGGRRVVFMHEADIAATGLQQGQMVDLTNRHGGAERVARGFMVAPYRIPRGCVATYFPEANVLVPIGSVAARSNTPTSKYVVVAIAAAH